MPNPKQQSLFPTPIVFVLAIALGAGACERPNDEAGEPALPQAGEAQAPAEASGLDGEAATGEQPDPAAEQAEPQPSFAPTTYDALSAEQRAALDAARLARTAMGASLVAALTTAAEQGLPNAIDVCRIEAPRLAADAATPSLRIGRTSHRLRNPDNAAPEWASAHVQAAVAEPLLVVGSNGVVGELAPIETAPRCLGCHGPADALDPSVRATLMELYPEDQAVGFAEGELRGWFWLEVEPG